MSLLSAIKDTFVITSNIGKSYMKEPLVKTAPHLQPMKTTPEAFLNGQMNLSKKDVKQHTCHIFV